MKTKKLRYPKAIQVGSRAILVKDITKLQFSKREVDSLRVMLKNGTLPKLRYQVVKRRCQNCNGKGREGYEQSHYGLGPGISTISWTTDEQRTCRSCGGRKYRYELRTKKPKGS